LARHSRAPDFVPTTHSAEALALELPDVETGRVFFPCGDLARRRASLGLAQRGAFVDEVVVYRTVAG
jgi:uroporphyrinogen-III synthase